MNRIRLPLVAIALAAAVIVAGCKKEEPPPPPPAVVTPEPLPAPPPPPVAATASITAVDVGSVVGADGKVTTPSATFAKKDTITASITTTTSDPAAAVSGTLNAKLSYQDGQVVSDEPKSFSFTGSGTTNFTFAKPDGWPAGKYKIDVSLDGVPSQSKDIEVK